MPAQITTTDVRAGEYRLRISTAGDPSAEPLLFLHGSGPGVSGLSNWERLIGDLGDRYHCIAPDTLGFGDSDHPNPRRAAWPRSPNCASPRPGICWTPSASTASPSSATPTAGRCPSR
ncbi:alpha/beta fold hydrolase [Actinomadura sp. WMMB 499]|uniref:alpha/beta fold hydrolase n=1 Tax=Actinomadura sp. WMMB 499 TaxID=1219491 RepID=UPI001C3F7587|nr:alpha/beta fold hydrolase [Actinomadura sp. WMMB 499]